MSAREPAIESVRDYLQDLQERIVSAVRERDPAAALRGESREDDRGLSRPRVLVAGRVFDQAAANFTHSRGESLPPAATGRRPDLAGRGFQAVSLSVILHAVNPYVPTTHMNLRYFEASAPGQRPVWWFGGGFDLTPVYGFAEDAVSWHRGARDACAPFGAAVYPRAKQACDEYFTLPHRNEARGVGGVFFDDLDDLDDLAGLSRPGDEGGPGATGEERRFDRVFALVRSVGDVFLPAYLEIVDRRRDTPYGDRERRFQELRRGRYVEFNLLHDRGTRYGLQSGRRVESVLASLPPRVRWEFGWRAEPGSPEEALDGFLRPRDWLDEPPPA